MKKALSLILALFVCLSLCACGGNEAADTSKVDEDVKAETQSDETIEETPVEEEEPVEELPKEDLIYLNETVTIGNYEFTITGTEFNKVERLSNVNRAAGDGKIFLIVHYNIKNIGKTAVNPKVYFTVEYADGYAFSEHLDMLEMDPLSASIDDSVAVEVPEIIKEDYNSNLKIIVRGLPLGVEGGDRHYYLNPMDETQKEAVYNAAKQLMENGFYNEAYDYFMRCGDYKDSADMIVKINTYSDIIYNPASYAEKLGEFRAVEGEEISTLLLGGNFMMSKTGEYWTFKEDNILYDTYCNDNPFMNQYAKWGYGNFQPTWEIKDDKLVVTGLNGDGKKVNTAFSVYEVDNGVYLLNTNSKETLVGDLIGNNSGMYSLYKKGLLEERFVMR